jgi:hypothetical protein
MISTSTSPARGPSRSTSCISSGLFGAVAMAALVFIDPVSAHPEEGLSLAKARLEGRTRDTPLRRRFDKLSGSSG